MVESSLGGLGERLERSMGLGFAARLEDGWLRGRLWGEDFLEREEGWVEDALGLVGDILVFGSGSFSWFGRLRGFWNGVVCFSCSENRDQMYDGETQDEQK